MGSLKSILKEFNHIVYTRSEQDMQSSNWLMNGDELAYLTKFHTEHEQYSHISEESTVRGNITRVDVGKDENIKDLSFIFVEIYL